MRTHSLFILCLGVLFLLSSSSSQAQSNLAVSQSGLWEQRMLSFENRNFFYFVSYRGEASFSFDVPISSYVLITYVASAEFGPAELCPEPAEGLEYNIQDCIVLDNPDYENPTPVVYGFKFYDPADPERSTGAPVRFTLRPLTEQAISFGSLRRTFMHLWPPSEREYVSEDWAIGEDASVFLSGLWRYVYDERALDSFYLESVSDNVQIEFSLWDSPARVFYLPYPSSSGDPALPDVEMCIYEMNETDAIDCVEVDTEGNPESELMGLVFPVDRDLFRFTISNGHVIIRPLNNNPIRFDGFRAEPVNQ